MRRKLPVTLNLPPRIRAMGEAYAEANGLSLSAWLEDLMRRDMEKSGVNVNLPPDELTAAMAKWIEEKLADGKKPRRPARKKKAVEKK